MLNDDGSNRAGCKMQNASMISACKSRFVVYKLVEMPPALTQTDDDDDDGESNRTNHTSRGKVKLLHEYSHRKDGSDIFTQIGGNSLTASDGKTSVLVAFVNSYGGVFKNFFLDQVCFNRSEWSETDEWNDNRSFELEASMQIVNTHGISDNGMYRSIPLVSGVFSN